MDIKKSRIGILDGFRALAILSVMLYHYFSRWTPPKHTPGSLYPYGSEYNYFNYGYLGVHFFFMISGFVIFFTLDNTNYFASFWKKRLIRLVPSMVIASLITFTVFILFDHEMLFPDSHSAKNFLPSFTFISPELFNQFSGTVKFYFINGSYWSLWTEIQFYLFSSTLFYLNKEKFIRNFILFSVALILIKFLFANILTGSNKFNIAMPAKSQAIYQLWIFEIFNLFNYLPFFSMGVLFYLLFKNRQNNITTSLFRKCSLAAFLLLAVFSGVKPEVRIIYAAMFILFFCFVYYPDKFLVFEYKILTTIGVSSYFLYLIHENIGVFLINRLGHYFLPAGFVFTLLLITALVLFSWLFTEKIDVKINRILRRYIPIKH